ncbi:hypothetical protein BDN72DRAFT_876711 [Pluteus cervinus]|uniref:Uncharacterized protein n=1 Tax=Pluteus cervinus TaxID=181527 RepID=A0ACD3B2P7_9AGAR|nr:hypothetical protein BDN72DRAFT_876711 [Pluteus cervinus]
MNLRDNTHLSAYSSTFYNVINNATTANYQGPIYNAPIVYHMANPETTAPTVDRREMLIQVRQKLAVVSYLESHGEASRRTDEETGGWLLDTKVFQDWSNAIGEVKAILAVGDPGVGKTCLVSLVIEHLQRTYPTQVAYFYFHSQEAEAQTPNKIVSSLLKQLLSTYSSLPDLAIRLYDQLDQGIPQLEVLVTTLLNLLQDKQATTFIVLDALDECKESYQQDFIHFLRQLLQAKVQLFVTSRPTSADIGDLFNISSCIKQPIKANPFDIQKVLTKKLESKKSLGKIMNGEFKAEAIETIQSRAQGVFLIAAMQAEHILSLTTKGQIKSVLTQFSSGLDDNFKITLGRIQNQQSGDRVKIALEAMKWIIHAHRPFTITELLYALATGLGSDIFDSDNLTTPLVVVESCYGFLILDDEDSDNAVVKFCHSSVQDFIQRQQLPPPHFEKLVTLTCLTYLSFDKLKVDEKILLWLDEVKALNLLSRFYDYAAKHWGEHVEQCYDDDDVVKAVDIFIGKNGHVRLWGQMDYGAQNTEQKVCSNSISMLHIVARFGMEKLLAQKSLHLQSQINARVAWTQETPLMLASRYKHRGVVQWLASYPMLELNVTRADGMTALTLAIEGGDDGIVAMLLERKDIDILGKTKEMEFSQSSGWISPLIKAVECGHAGVVKMLLDKNPANMGIVTLCNF